MTTDSIGSGEDPATKKLTEHILKGDPDQAAQSAREISSKKADAKDVVDAISDAMNIVADLHEVERYSSEQVENCEMAAEKALAAVRPKIRVEQSKISGRVLVASLEGDLHSFDKTLLLAMLEIGGFTALDGGTEVSPEEIVDKARELKPDVIAVPLVTSIAAKKLLVARSLMDSVGEKPHIVAYGRGAAELSHHAGLGAVEGDSLGAISRITELLMSK